MAENTKIEWADHTWNPWIGCTKVSPGCDHCYAERRMDTRLHAVQWGAGAPRRRTKTWGDPKRWNDQHAAFFAQHGRRQRVFCASLADVFDNEVDPAWRVDLFALIAATPNLDWLLLTKRIGNVSKMLGDYRTVPLLPNIWLGATVVNQEEADRDIQKLLAVPARVRFLSIEPMLGPIDLGCTGGVRVEAGNPDPIGRIINQREAFPDGDADGQIDWVIVGGESGPGARPMHPDWARGLRDQCTAAGVPFLFKQWGEWAPISHEPIRPESMRLPGNLCRVQSLRERDYFAAVSVDGLTRIRIEQIGKKAAGRVLDGMTHDGFPE